MTQGKLFLFFFLLYRYNDWKFLQFRIIYNLISRLLPRLELQALQRYARANASFAVRLFSTISNLSEF